MPLGKVSLSEAVGPILDALTHGPGLLAVAALVGYAVHFAAWTVLLALARREDTFVTPDAARRVRHASRVLLPLLAVRLALTDADLHGRALDHVQHGLAIALIAAVAWALVAAVEGVESCVVARHRVDVADNLRARTVHTQFQVLSRVLDIAIVIVAGAAILMTFPSIRALGASLMASAGIAGIVVGLAARPTLSNLIAGLQIALAEPIRLDDVVIVQGEWGRIEQLTGAFVVVKVWDERRLVVPLAWFLENPFQNWTRTSSELHGAVFLNLDHTAPIDALREELARICEGAEEWDGRHRSVLVTDATERTIQVRALVSGRDSGRLWDLRCKVREGLVDFLRREHPGALPRVRAELEATPEGL